LPGLDVSVAAQLLELLQEPGGFLRRQGQVHGVCHRVESWASGRGNVCREARGGWRWVRADHTVSNCS
jgi:hypothetical protein